MVSKFHVRGHLIDSGLLSDAMEAVHAAGAAYEITRLDIGRLREDVSELEIQVTAKDEAAFERLQAALDVGRLVQAGRLLHESDAHAGT